MSTENQNPKKITKDTTLKTGKFMDFTIKREEWNRYKLSDGSIVRGRVILASCLMGKTLEETVEQLKPKEEFELDLVFNNKTMFAVEVPPELRRSPSTEVYTQAELNEAIIEKDMDFQTLKELWNLYKLENGIVLKIRLSLVAVNKTSKFERGGMPIYTVNSNIDVKIDLPANIQKLLEKKGKKMLKISPLE